MLDAKQHNEQGGGVMSISSLGVSHRLENGASALYLQPSSVSKRIR